MSKKMMLFALSVVSAALFALPAVASATPAHIEGLADSAFTVHAKEGSLSTTSNETVFCATTTGSGELETSTTGSLNLEFHGCKAKTIFGDITCTTHPSSSGTILAKGLTFHLFSPGKSGEKGTILVTQNDETKEYASFTCGGLNKTVEGTGLVGTVLAPDCDTESETATLDFNATAHGVKSHATITGTTYTFTSNGTTAAMDTTATVSFNEPGFYNCTP